MSLHKVFCFVFFAANNKVSVAAGPALGLFDTEKRRKLMVLIILEQPNRFTPTDMEKDVEMKK